MSDADDRFLETLARELAPLLGPRIRLAGLDLERPRDGWVRVVALLDTSGGHQRLVEEGDSVTSVAAALLECAPVERLADGFREIVEPASIERRTPVSR